MRRLARDVFTFQLFVICQNFNSDFNTPRCVIWPRASQNTVSPNGPAVDGPDNTIATHGISRCAVRTLNADLYVSISELRHLAICTYMRLKEDNGLGRFASSGQFPYTSLYIYIYIYIHTDIYMYMYIHTYIYIYIYICIYTHVCIH